MARHFDAFGNLEEHVANEPMSTSSEPESVRKIQYPHWSAAPHSFNELLPPEFEGMEHEQLEKLPTYVDAATARTLSKHEIEQSMKHLRIAYDERYSFAKPREPLAGNLPRGFSADQLREFFCFWPLHLEEARRRLLRAFFYGLRVGEIEKAVLHGDLIKISVLKKGRDYTYYLPLIPGTERLFPPYTSWKRYHSNYLAKAFTARCDALGLDERHSPTKDGRMLRRYTSHTLRRTAGNLVRKKTCDVYKAKMFLRHNPSSHFGATARYLDYDMDEMRADLEETFLPFVDLL